MTHTHHLTNSSSSSFLPPKNPSPTTSPPTAHSNSTLNLSVLRRYLPTITTIITIAAYTVIYIFRPTLSTWEKSGIEGTLFVVRLDGGTKHERYAIIVLNRRGLDNFIIYLKSGEEVEVTQEYVIVTDEQQGEVRIWGLWIFDEEGGSTGGSRERVGGVIVDCARKVERRGLEGWMEGDGDMDGGEENGFGEKREVQQQARAEKGRGPDLMALLNGSVGHGGGGVSVERHKNPDQSQALLDLFRKTS